jgi:hypothetical protein
VDIITGFNIGYNGNKNIQRGSGKRGSKEAMRDGIVERIDYSRKEGWISCSWKRTRQSTIGNEF